jgi:predicted Zn finger-like uncharacterized protein
MVINCIQCHTKYRLNGELVRGAKGMQVRCRKCGCIFDVQIIPPALKVYEAILQLKFQFAKNRVI